MNSQHLSDEAVAAFADGVLTGHARERATRHTASCAECASAVQVQREAAWALRAAAAPALPSGLFDRLCGLPAITPVTSVPTAVDSDGSMMFSTLAPVAAFAPSPPRSQHRGRPFVTTAAVVALAGALTAGSLAARRDDPPIPIGTQTGDRHVVDPGVTREIGPDNVFTNVSVFRTGGN